MALERDFITPADLVVQTTANVVGNTTSVDMFANTARSQTLPSLYLNFVMNPVLDSRMVFTRTSNATYVAANGLIAYASANTPRFEYDPVSGQCRGMLFEEQRTNLFGNSNNITETTWGGYGSNASGATNLPIGLLPNAGVAPDGTNSATFFYWKGTTWQYQLVYPGQFINFPTNRTYTQSIFVKANTTPQETSLYISHYDSTDGGEVLQVFYNPVTNVFTSAAYGSNVVFMTPPAMQDYPNGWKRLFFSFKYTGGSTHDIQFKHALQGATTANSINNQGVYIWGTQLELGPNPTSYIPTPTAASATRTQDTVRMSISNFKTSSMTLVSKYATVQYTGNTLFDQNYNLAWTLGTDPPEPGGLYNFIWQRTLTHGGAYTSQHYLQYTYNTVPVGSSGYAGFGYPIIFNLGYNQPISNATYITSAVAMQPTSAVFSTGNSSPVPIAPTPLSPNTNTLWIGGDNGVFGGYSLNGYVATLSIYPRMLSNTELVNITAL